MTSSASSSPLWIFGYGSLIWRADFAFVEKRPAYIRDFSRRFWQGSSDHRGMPGAPGRVVTLIEDLEACCAGMAYRIDPTLSSTVLARLDHREQGGYDQLQIPIHFSPTEVPSPASPTMRTQPTPAFLGTAPVDSIARQIVDSTGPSGPNSEYVLELDQRTCASINRALAQDPDNHVAAIATAVRRLLCTAIP